MKTMRIIALAATLLLVLSACGGDEPGANIEPTPTSTTTPTPTPTDTTTPSRTGSTVDVIDNEYRPAELTVTTGTEVTWSYVGPDARHTVTATNPPFDSHPECPANLDACMKAAGETFRFVFTAVGRFTYACKVHGELMSGTIIVE